MTGLQPNRVLRALLAAGIAAASLLAVHADAMAPDRLPACPPMAAHLSSGPLPHRSFTLYTDRFNRWHPVATDDSYVLMGWEYSREPVFGGPVHLSLVHLPSTRLVPVPRGAYPRATFLGLWQLDWPWIAGIATTTPLPAFPADWRLWAGNVVTGRHIILDSYRLHPHPVSEFYPHFALNAGRIVWEYSSNRPGFAGYSAERIALANLASGRRTFLTAPDPTGVEGRISFSGTRIVWERTGTAGTRAAVDLWLYDLRSHSLTRLSRNSAGTSSSLYPALARRYLLFEQGQPGSDGGVPYLVELGTKRGVTQSTPGPRWWRAYRYRWLGRDGLTNTQLGDGLVSWDFWQLLDVTRSRVWYERFWRVQAISGRTVLVYHQNPETGHETYAAWQIPAACTASGFQ